MSPGFLWTDNEQTLMKLAGVDAMVKQNWIHRADPVRFFIYVGLKKFVTWFTVTLSVGYLRWFPLFFSTPFSNKSEGIEKISAKSLRQNLHGHDHFSYLRETLKVFNGFWFSWRQAWGFPVKLFFWSVCKIRRQKFFQSSLN